MTTTAAEHRLGFKAATQALGSIWAELVAQSEYEIQSDFAGWVTTGQWPTGPATSTMREIAQGLVPDPRWQQGPLDRYVTYWQEEGIPAALASSYARYGHHNGE